MARPQRPRITPIAGPILGEFLIGISVTMAALWMASQISDASAGAFGMSQQLLESLFVLFRVLAIGVGVTITQALGGRQAEAARRTALVGLGACTWAGAVAAAWLLFFGDWTLEVLNAPDAVAALAGPYLPLLAVAALLEAYNLVMASILRAHLHARDTLFVMLVMHATNLALAFPLMLGLGDWDGLGLPGYALSLTLSRGAGLGLHLWLWRRRMNLVPTQRDWWYCPARALMPVLRIGVPGASLDVAYRLAFMMSLSAAAKLGVAALATQAYVLQTLRYVLLVSLAIGWACEIMVGHLIGSGKFRRCTSTGAQGLAQRPGCVGHDGAGGGDRCAVADARLHARSGSDPGGADLAVDLARARDGARRQSGGAGGAALDRRRDLPGLGGHRVADPGARRRLGGARPALRAGRHLDRLRGRRVDPRRADVLALGDPWLGRPCAGHPAAPALSGGREPLLKPAHDRRTLCQARRRRRPAP